MTISSLEHNSLICPVYALAKSKKIQYSIAEVSPVRCADTRKFCKINPAGYESHHLHDCKQCDGAGSSLAEDWRTLSGKEDLLYC